MNLFKITLLLALALLFQHCQPDPTPHANTTSTSTAFAADPHSFAQPNDAVTRHLDLNLHLDFDKKTAAGSARWAIENRSKGSKIIFDTKGLNIKKITLGKDERETTWKLTEPDSILGTALEIAIGQETNLLTIYYSTPPNAAAFSWLTPAQTVGKKMPFLFTQGQAILARTWIPCQDSPGIRITYNATINAPPGMLVLMSADNPQLKSADGKYTFKMDKPISPYLIALAAGDIEFQAIGKRTGVYAEPTQVQKVAWEFADMERMVEAAEALYGEYSWGRYDLIVLPLGFPFGGMENPKLTFATPTVVTGKRDLVALVAHELAHSWSGNLVTNATWNDFWLNEGFTVYFERRIMEKLYGKDYVTMLAQLEYQELLDEIEALEADGKPQDTQLQLDLAGRDPDEAGTAIAYQKGSFFLQLVEEKTGRERFDTFLKQYFKEHQFKTITTAQFLDYLRKNLLDKYRVDVNVDEWVYQLGLPESCPKPQSDRFTNVERQAVTTAEKLPDTTGWISHEWVHFLRHLTENVDVATLKKLDGAFQLTNSGNGEILLEWYSIAIRRGYSAAILPKIEAFLVGVGRRRLVLPIYKAFVEMGQAAEARRIFEKAKDGYHAVTRNSVEELLLETR